MIPIVAKIKHQAQSLLQRTRIGVDVGTSMTRIAINNKGIVLREPTFAGQNSRTGEYIFYGTEAKDIYGKAPGFIQVIKPFNHSIISDFDATVYLMQQFLKKAVYPYYQSSFIKRGLEGYSVVPTNATEVEQKALQEALIKAGFHAVSLIEKPIAAAYGAGHNIFTNKPVFVVDFGAGIVEAAIMTMGGIVSSKVMKLGGDHMDKLIYNYLHLKYGLIIGEQTAEHLKVSLFNLAGKKDVLPVRGKSLENGLPKSVRVTSDDVQEALAVAMNQIIDGIKELIETVPPEIIDGLIKSGVVFTGEFAKTPGIDRFISNEIKIPVTIAANPEDATIHGLQKLIKEDDRLRRVVIAG